MSKKIFLVCFCLFRVLFQVSAAKGDVKYETNEICKETGNLYLETKDCTFRNITTKALLSFVHWNGVSSMCFWFYHNSMLRDRNIYHDFSLTLSFSDGSVETLINEGFSVIPYKYRLSTDNPTDYRYTLYFNLDDELLNKLSTVPLTRIRANDLYVVCPDLDLVNVKSYARRVEEIQNMAADFSSRVKNYEGGKEVKYAQSETDEFLNKKMFETEKINMSKNQTISFRAEDTTFYVNTEIFRIGFASLIGSKIRFVYEDLTYNDVNVSQTKDKRLNDDDYVNQLYDYSCQAVCPRHVMENIVQKKLAYVRFLYGVSTSSSQITNPDLIGRYANDILNKVYPNYQYSVPKSNRAKAKKKTNFYDFECDENDANNWLVRHALVDMSESLVMSLNYEVDNLYLNGFHLKFRLIKNEDFYISHDKNVFLKLENGDVVNVKTNNVKYSSTLHPKINDNTYKYYVENAANMDYETIQKLSKSKIAKVRIVITKNSIDENVDLEVESLGAEMIQMQAKEMVDKIKIK